MIDRRDFIGNAVALGVTAALAPALRAAAAPSWRNALSVSPFTEFVLREKIAYGDGRAQARTTGELQRLFMDHGSSEVYARLGTRRGITPNEGDHSVVRGLELAKLSRELGVPINPELGLFAFYGDITHQPEPDFADYPSLAPPKPWHELGVAQMTDILRRYGALIAREILDTGASVNVWDLGNEVERGVAGVAAPPIREPAGWKYRAPDAVDPEIGRMDILRYIRLDEAKRIEWLEAHLWPHVGALFAATAEGIRSVDPHARFSTHTSGMVAHSSAMFIHFYEAMDAAGFRCDEAGLSFYPSASKEPPDRFAALRDMLATAVPKLGRRAFIAEYAYPVGPFKFGADDWDHALPGYPVSRDGQAKLARDLVDWGVQSGHLSGVRPWAPDLVLPGWAEMSCFDLDGRKAGARPSLEAFAPRSKPRA